MKMTLLKDHRYTQRDIIKNHNVVTNGKNFYDQPIYSNIKRYEEIRKNFFFYINNKTR